MNFHFEIARVDCTRNQIFLLCLLKLTSVTFFFLRLINRLIQSIQTHENVGNDFFLSKWSKAVSLSVLFIMLVLINALWERNQFVNNYPNSLLEYIDLQTHGK